VEETCRAILRRSISDTGDVAFQMVLTVPITRTRGKRFTLAVFACVAVTLAVFACVAVAQPGPGWPLPRDPSKAGRFSTDTDNCERYKSETEIPYCGCIVVNTRSNPISSQYFDAPTTDAHTCRNTCQGVCSPGGKPNFDYICQDRFHIVVTNLAYTYCCPKPAWPDDNGCKK
jgi:hypothetical protein